MANKEEIKTIYNKYALDLYRYSYSVLKSHEDAEDLVATVFEKLLKLKEINDITIKAWLFTVAHNLMMDKFKATKTLVQIDNKKISELSADDNVTPESGIIVEEEVEIIKSELERLTPEQKEVLILKTWEDYKFYEIATILGSSENTVKSHYYRALKNLKTNIQKHHGKKYVLAFPILVTALSAVKTTIPNLLSKNIMANLFKNVTTAATSAATALPLKIVMGLIATAIIATAIGVGIYLHKSRSNESKVVDEQNIQVEDQTDEGSAEDEEEDTNDASMEKETKEVDYSIEGVLGLDGSADQYEIFESQKCKIIDNETKYTIVDCSSCSWDTEKAEENKICIWEYSELVEGPQNSHGQYFFMTGGEGGGDWTDVYYISFDTNILSLKEKFRCDLTNYDSCKESMTGYNVDYYSTLAYRLDIPSCDFPNEYNPECTVTMNVVNSEECRILDNLNEQFAEKCYKNWNVLTQNQKDDLLAKLNDLEL